MGRGLSELQKRILMLAYVRRQDLDFEKEREEDPDLYYPEVLAEVWGFPHTQLFPREYEAKYGRRVWSSGWWGKYFDRSEIGEKEYSRATTTLWRSASRLEDRRLVKKAFYGKPGLLLTDEGIETARRLSVEKGTGATQTF